MRKTKAAAGRRPARRQSKVSTARRPRVSAKLTVPKVTGATSRERLFDWLDKHSQHSLIWITGPPGCGKTTLAASYLQRSAPLTLWYRVDSGDTDLPTVFHNLRLAARQVAGAAAEHLPLLTPEYLFDVPTFARNFFGALFALLDTPAALVIDNAHDAADELLETILTAVVAERCDGVRIFAISRNDPPGAISALQVKGTLAQLGWERLRLTLEEARAIGASAGLTSATFIQRQYELCDGWVAGLVLLLEHARQLSGDEPLLSTRTRGALFNYFSGELFAAAPASAQRLLLSTALLPSFTMAQAGAFSSAEEAQRLIGWLLQRNFFIDSVPGLQPVYRYHDLFREFLLERGRSAFDAGERRALLTQAMHGAEAAVQLETAVALAAEAASWIDVVRLICSLAPQTLQQGRGVALERWIGSLPASLVAATPWVLYWRGMARLVRDPAEGRRSLEAAFALFESDSQQIECLMACAGIIHSFFLEWGDQHPLDPWVEKYRALSLATEGRIPAEIEARLLPCMMGIVLRHLGDPLLERSVARAWSLIEKSLDSVQLVPLLFLLLVDCQTNGDWTKGLPLLAYLNRVVNDDAPPLTRLYYRAGQLTWRAMCAAYASEAEGHKEIQHFIDLGERSGIHALDVYGLAQGVYFALNWQDPDLAEQLLARIGPRLLPTRIMDLAHYAWLRAAVALERGDMAGASAQMDASMAHAHACGTRFGLCQNRILAAQVHLANADVARARELIDQALAQARAMRTITFEHAALLVKAYVQLRSGDQSQGLQSLRDGLVLGRRTGQSVIAPAAPSILPSFLYATALLHGIEVDYVRSLIKTYRVRPPPLSLESDALTWPWPVRVYTLGRFTLVTGGGPVRISGKAQKKPLQVLQALIALGGRSVSLDALARQVWPRHSASARGNLNVALVRLRRLLGDPQALVLSTGRLTLNERVCWVDLWTFERAVGAAGQQPADPERREGALELYRGAFLGDDDELACVTRLRDRMAAKFQRLALELGLQHEAAGRYERAAHVYRLGLERDNLMERFHQRLIDCEWKLGHRAEAIRAYRRCRELLQRHLNAKPSRETERLHQQIQAE